MPHFPFEHILLRTLAEHVPHRIYAKDTECRFVFANKAVALGMGTSGPADLIGKTDFGFYPEECAAQYFAEEQRIMHTGVPMLNKEEHVHYELSNEDAWMLTTKVPLLDDSGQVIGIAGINYDITDRKAAEQALRDAKLRAERADRAKGDSLAMLSHELRTPLNVVLGHAQDLQRDEGLSERQVSSLKAIERSGEQLLLLVNDLLAMATVEAGELRFLPAQVNLPELIQIVGDVIRVRVAGRRLSFKCELDPSLPAVVLTDGRRLTQILLILLGNAARFTDVGEISMRARKVSEMPSRARIRFEVENKGEGLHIDELAQMLQPYADGDDSAPPRAAGLGLTISRHLVEAMGGALEAQTQPGSGSLLSFELDFEVALSLSAELPAASLQHAMHLVLPNEQIETLIVLAKTGSMREIASFSERLLRLGDQYRGLAERLKYLADRFESKEILEFALSLQRETGPQSR